MAQEMFKPKQRKATNRGSKICGGFGKVQDWNELPSLLDSSVFGNSPK